MSEMTCTKPTTGIVVPCIRCGETSASVCLNLASLADECFQCLECEAEYSIEDVEAFMAEMEKWKKVLNWVSLVPQFEE